MTNQTPDENGNYGLNSTEDTLNALLNSELEDFQHYPHGIFYNPKTHLAVYYDTAAMADMTDLGPAVQYYTQIHLDDLYHENYEAYDKLKTLNQELLIQEVTNTLVQSERLRVAIHRHRHTVYCCEGDQ